MPVNLNENRMQQFQNLPAYKQQMIDDQSAMGRTGQYGGVFPESQPTFPLTKGTDPNNPLSYLFSEPNQIGGKVLPAILAEYLSYIQPTTATGRAKDIAETITEPYTNILSGRGGLEDYAFAALPAAKYGKPFYKAARKGYFLKGEKGGADFEFLMRALRQRLGNPKEALKSVPVKHIPTPPKTKKKKKKKKDKGIKKDFPVT